jgi:peroxiredoxin
MKKHLLAALLAAGALATPAFAALAVNDSAPDFTLSGFQAGKPITFSLNQALKNGPVVLYFFPAVHTGGCNLEAHLFAEAADEFKAQHATVIGVTAGNTDKLEKFSTDTQYCSGKFAMALDDGAKIAMNYKSTLAERPLSDRTSYVIGKDHKIALVYSNLNPNDHVTQTMGAVKKLNGKS